MTRRLTRRLGRRQTGKDLDEATPTPIMRKKSLERSPDMGIMARIDTHAEDSVSLTSGQYFRDRILSIEGLAVQEQIMGLKSSILRLDQNLQWVYLHLGHHVVS